CARSIGCWPAKASPLPANQVRCLLADHDRRRVGIARRHSREDRRVGDAHPFEAVYFESLVDHGIAAATHAAGADWMIGGVCGGADEVEDLRVARDLSARRILLPA